MMRRATGTFLLLCVVVGLPGPAARAQGIASTGREPAPAQPLPEGIVPPRVDFRDITREAGISAPRPAGAPGKAYLVETTGTGVALFDFDGDGLLDIFFVGPARIDQSERSVAHTLYRNRGRLRFEDVSAGSGLASKGFGQGTCAGDVDDDGLVDLLVTHWGQDRLFRNLGGGRFADVTASSGLAEARVRWGTGCAFLDFDRDGDLDLFVAQYVDFDPAATPLPGEAPQCRWKGVPIPCGPRGLPAETMSLYRNDGNGSFVDVSAGAGISGPASYYGLGVLTGDYDGDGWTDVYVACDSTPSLLYRNLRNGTFEELGLSSGTAYNEDGHEQAGMGVAAADYDGDGLLDVFKTNFAADTNTLYRNEGEWVFADMTLSAGLGVRTREVGWGTAFLDVDKDGWKDLVAVNGHIAPSVDGAPIQESYRQPAMLFWNLGTGFFHDLSQSAGESLATPHSARGLAAGDLDNDGSEEIVFTNLDERPVLLANRGSMQNWLRVRVLTESGRPDLGAQVRVIAGGRSQVEEVRSGGSYLSHSDTRVHFGIGQAPRADVEVRWLSGRTARRDGVAANQQLVFRDRRTPADPE